MEEQRVPYGGGCWEVWTNSAGAGCPRASLPTDVISATSAILEEKIKKATHGCEPWGQAQQLCQCRFSKSLR